MTTVKCSYTPNQIMSIKKTISLELIMKTQTLGNSDLKGYENV